MVMDREQLRDTLRALLHEAGLGQREASRLLGMSDTTVHNWLAGHSEPRLQSLRDFAQLCGRQAVIDFPRLGEADPLRLLEGEQADEVRQLVQAYLLVPPAGRSAVRVLLDMAGAKSNSSKRQPAPLGTESSAGAPAAGLESASQLARKADLSE